MRARDTQKTLEIDGCLTGVDAEATRKDLDALLAKADAGLRAGGARSAPEYGEAWAEPRHRPQPARRTTPTAERYLSKALENPMRLVDPALTRANLGWALFHQKKLRRCGEGAAPGARSSSRRCAWQLIGLARVYFAREEWEKAAELFQTVSDDPSCGSQEASYYLMKTRMQQGLGDDAKTRARRVSEAVAEELHRCAVSSRGTLRCILNVKEVDVR